MTFWELCLPPGQWPPAFGGEGAAGATLVLLLWRRARLFLAKQNFLWGKCSPLIPCRDRNRVKRLSSQTLYSFQDKLYILSSQEAYQKFVTNPRRYLLHPMPRPHCKVSIVGPRLAGKSTLCRLLAQHYGAVVLDMEELSQPVLARAEQEKLDKIKKETTQAAIEKIKMKMKKDGEEHLGTLDTFFCMRVIKHDSHI